MSSGTPTVSEEETVAMQKLDMLKEIRNRTMELEKLKGRIKNEIDITEGEEKCLHEYKKELEALLQEKMAHVEDLRQIHADINSMENVIKQSEEDRNRHLDSAKHMNKEYAPLKELVDKMRSDIGLPRLPEIHEEDERFKPEFFEKQRVSDWHSANADRMDALAGTGGTSSNENNLSSSLLTAASHQQQLHLAAVAAARASKNSMGHGLGMAAAQHTGLSSVSGMNMSQTPSHVDRTASSAFRQAPPPMKACLSCHQQIHRNAPICPLCKAKSRSRNPKKPKRKMGEIEN